MSERDSISLDEVAKIEKKSKMRFSISFLWHWFLERMASNFPVPTYRVKFHRARGINIGKDVYIGYDVIFDRIHTDLITIEDYVEIGDRTIISTHSRGTLPLRKQYPRTTAAVTIKKGAWIAPGCIILQGVTIGEKSVIGTGSVVTKDIPPNSVAVGIPAKVIKIMDDE